jgi:hypothetical protein
MAKRNDNEREVTSASQPEGEEQVETEVVGGQEDPQVDPDVVAALEEAAEDGELDGGIAPLSVQEAEVEHASEAYNLEVPGAGVVEATVEADLEARKALAADSHREVENEELYSLAIGEEAPPQFAPLPVFVNTIRPDEKVQVVVGERTPETPNDYGIESTEQERIVKELAESGQLFEKGGPLVDWDHDTADLSDGVDGLFLAERSKQTGTKLF